MQNNALKIALNAVPLAPGGGLTGLLGYLEAWKELDFPLDITVFASRKQVIDSIQKIRKDIKVVPFALGSKSWQHFFLQQTKLGHMIDRGRFDALMTTQYGVRNCNIPQLVHHRNLKRFIYPTLKKRLLTGAWQETIKDYAARVSLQHANCNVFISQFMMQEAEKIISASTHRNYVIHNGLPSRLLSKKYSPGTKLYRREEIIAIQDASEHKDNPTLIRTFKELCLRRPDVNWHLKIAGGGDWEPIKKLARTSGILESISFCGFLSQKELSEMIGESLCLVFTSILEGFGNPPLEAMANGCPVIACRCSAMPEVIEDSGMLVNPGNYSEFTSSIIELYDNQQLRQEYVEKGFRRIKAFSWHSSATQMYDLLLKIAK